MRSISTRRAAAADADAILACLRAAFAPFQSQYSPDAYTDTVLTRETVQQRLTSMALFVAEAEGTVVGTIGCSVISGDEGHLRGMAVLPEWQGRNIAQLLLDAAEQELRARGCSRVTLDTTAPLLRAMRFYEKNGYHRSGTVTDFFGMPLYEYEKTLADGKVKS